MVQKKKGSWVERAMFDDALSSVDNQWIQDVYDQLEGDGYPDDVILGLIGDLIEDPNLLYRESLDSNPFISDDAALKKTIDRLAVSYLNRKPGSGKDQLSFYKMDTLRDKMKVRRAFPFLNVDSLNNNLFTTRLNGDDEKKFSNWFSGYAESHDIDPDPDNPEHYYDARGWWKEASNQERFSAASDPRAHLSDRFKMPGHPTFSEESKYHDPTHPETTGGRWSRYGFFRPSEYQRSRPGRYVSDRNERKIRQRYTESAFVDDAYMPTSRAMGAYQIAPGAYKDFVDSTGIRGDLNNAKFNERVRDWYMDRLPSYMASDVYYDDEPEDVRLAKIYAAYNWGAGNVNKHLRAAQEKGIDIHGSTDWLEGMPKETRDYVNFIVLDNDATDRLSTNKFDSAVERWRNGR